MSSNTSNPNPRECLDSHEELVLVDDVKVENVEEEVEEESDLGHLKEQWSDLVLHSKNAYLVQDDGSLVHFAPFALGPSDGLGDSRNEELPRSEQARATCSLTSPVGSAEPAAAVAGGSGIDRGRGERGGDISARGSAWSCGKAFVERFATDEDLPARLRRDIKRVTAARSRRARAERERRAARAVVEEGDSEWTDDEEGGAVEDEEFVWAPMDGWHGAKETFLPETVGPTRAFRNPYEAFRSYWDDSLLSQIVDETNRSAREIQSKQFQRKWYDTNLDELLILFAFWIMLGIVRMPTIRSCFSTMALLRTEIFRSMFTEDRYWSLNKAFRVANGTRDANGLGNVWCPMGPLIDQLNVKFQQNYGLQQDIRIEESLALWKGAGGIRYVITTEAAEFKIKIYELSDSETGYLWSFFVDISPTPTSAVPASVATVVRLLQPLLNLGHVLYLGNRLSSPTLVRYLKRRRTDCVGPLQASLENVPAVIQRTPLVKGEFVARQSGDVMVVALQDRKRFTYISTFHDVTQVHIPDDTGRPAQLTFKLFDDYNRGFSGVDSFDETLEPYLVKRNQCTNWTMNLFKRLLNITVQNMRVLLDESSPTATNSITFRLALVDLILNSHISKLPSPDGSTPRPRSSFAQFPAERLTERHFIRYIPISPKMRAQPLIAIKWPVSVFGALLTAVKPELLLNVQTVKCLSAWTVLNRSTLSPRAFRCS